MISSFVQGKVYVFIDGANVFYSQRTLGWRISYAKFIEYFKRECDVGKCFVYIGTIVGNAKQKNFLDMLDAVGFIVRTKPVKVIRTKTGEVEWKEHLDRAKYVDLRKLKKELILEQ